MSTTSSISLEDVEVGNSEILEACTAHFSDEQIRLRITSLYQQINRTTPTVAILNSPNQVEAEFESLLRNGQLGIMPKSFDRYQAWRMKLKSIRICKLLQFMNKPHGDADRLRRLVECFWMCIPADKLCLVSRNPMKVDIVRGEGGSISYANPVFLG
jgi:hypothetical protein